LVITVQILQQRYIVIIFGHVHHRWRDHKTRCGWFPIGGPFTPTISLRYWDIVHKHISIVTVLATILGSFGNIGGYAIFRQGTPSGRRGASCEVLTTTIGQRASILQCIDRPIENALGLVKFWENWG